MYTPDAYVELIELFKSEGYRFVSFGQPVPSGERVVLLRHDVDYYPAWAVEMARLNRHCGVSGLFTWLLRSPLYNLCAPETLAAIDEISACGQDTGFHFAFSSPPAAELDQIATLVVRDYQIARGLVPSMRPVFSWHNPSLAPGLIERCLDLAVPGLLNLYSRDLFQSAEYRADSNWRYTIEDWQAIARAGSPRLQLVFHPFQWLAGGGTMLGVLARTFAELSRAQQREFLKNHLFRAAHPDGLPAAVFAALAAAVDPDGSLVSKGRRPLVGS